MITAAYKDYDNLLTFKKAWQLEAKQTQSILNSNWSKGGNEPVKEKEESKNVKHEILIKRLETMRVRCENMTPHEIALEVNYHYAVVLRHLKKLNIKSKKPVRTRNKALKKVLLQNAKWCADKTASEIRKQFGIETASNISKLLDACKIPYLKAGYRK